MNTGICASYAGSRQRGYAASPDQVECFPRVTVCTLQRYLPLRKTFAGEGRRRISLPRDLNRLGCRLKARLSIDEYSIPHKP